MPGNVDERVVEMRIDNKQFESGAKTTIGTLEKLERALHIKGDSKALDDMAKSVSSFDASPMASSLDKVEEHFSALEVAGRRVIENLTDGIYNFATKTVKQLVIEQPKEGWNKYETKAEAVQSIMAATRDMVTGISEVDENGMALSFESQEEQMEKVNELLEKMNWYTDETSYNFNDMAANVGKFLAAGVGLEDAFTAIMGIASWGGSAGAKPQEVSRAMYNISQAMSSGSMKAIDWKSIENAGMATLEFKQNAIDAAVALGRLNMVGNDAGHLAENADELIRYYDATLGFAEEIEDKDTFDAKSFREGLSRGWFDSEVMMEVYKRYGEFSDNLYKATEQTGLEATDILQLVDYMRKGTEIDWDKYAKDASMAVNDFKEVIQTVADVNWEFSENGFRMGQEAKTWTDMIEATKDAVSSEWMKTFQYIFGDYLEAKEFWTEMTGEFWDIFAAGGALRNEILDSWYSSGGRKALFGLDEDNIGAFWNIINSIKSVIGPIHDALSEVFGMDTQDGIASVGEKLADLTKRFQELTANMGLSDEAKEGLQNIFTVIFTGARDALKGFGAVVAVVGRFAWFLGEVLDAVLSLASGEVSLETVQDRIVGSFKRFIGALSFLEPIKDVIKSLPDSLEKVAYYLRILKSAGSKLNIDAIYGKFSKFEQFLFKIGQRFPFLADVFSFIGSRLEKLINYFREFTFTVPSFGGVLEKLAGWFSQLKNSINGVDVDLSSFKGIFGQLKDIGATLFAGLFGDPKQFKEKAKAFLSTVFGGIGEVLKEIKISDILKAAKLGINIGFLGGFLDIVRSIHLVANEVKTIPEAITDTLGSLQKSFEATSYIKIAVAIGILAASIYALSKVPADDFMRVVVGLGILALVLQKLGKGINIFSGSNNKGDTITKGLKANIKLIPDLAATILALAVAMGVMAAAVVSFKKNGIGLLDMVAPMAMLLVVLGSMVGFLYLLKKFNVKDVGKSFGLLITVFAIIGRVGKLAKTVQDVPWYNLIITFIGISGLVLSMAVLLRFASGFKKFSVEQILHLALLMAAIGFSIGAAARSLVKLAKLPFLSLVQGLLGVGLLIGGLAILITKMSKLDTSRSGGMLKLGGSLALMALAVNMLVVPLMTLAMLPFGKMLVGLLAIAGLMAILGGSLAQLSKMGESQTGALLKIAAAIALMSLGLSLAIPALITFTGFLVGLAAILNGKMIGKLALLSAIMVLLGAGLLVAGAGVALFGVGLLGVTLSAFLFSVALLAIASALDKLSEAFPKLIQGLIDTGKLMTKENAKNIALGAVAFIALGAGIYLVAKAFGALFGKGDVITKLGSFGGRLIGALGTLIHNVGAKIVDALPFILEILAGIAVVVGLYVIGLIPKLANTVVNAIITLLESIHQSVRANKGALEHSIFGTIEVLLEILIDSGTWVFSILRSLIDTGVGWILDQIASSAEKIPVLGDDIANSIRDIKNKLPGPEEIMDQWTEQKGTNASWLQQFVPPAQELQDVSSEVTDNLGIGIKNGKGSVQEAIDDLKGTVTEGLDAFKGDASTQGQGFISEYASGIDLGSESAVLSSNNVSGQVLSVFENMIPSANSSGAGFLSGWNDGFVDYWNNGTIQDNIGMVTNGMVSNLFGGLDEHSPSKISEQAGAFYIIGLANGISKNADLPLDAVDRTTNPMIEALKTAMMQIATMTDDDFTISPVITPVVDMSNVEAVAGSMNGAFGKSYSMAASINGAIDRRSNDIDQIASAMEKGKQTINNGDTYNFQIYQQPGEDAEALTDRIMARMQNRMVRRGAAFG